MSFNNQVLFFYYNTIEEKFILHLAGNFLRKCYIHFILLLENPLLLTEPKTYSDKQVFTQMCT